MPAARLLAGLFLATLVSAGVHAGDPELPHARPAIEGNRAPAQLVFSPDGRRLYVTEAAEGDVAVVDVPTFTVTGHLPTGGERPAGLALTPDGSELWVANSYFGNVVALDVATGKLRATVPLPGMPRGLVVAPDGKSAYVSLSQLDEVAVLSVPSASVVKRIPVGRRPQALALTPDGKTLAVANLSGGSLSIINTEKLAEEARVKLKGINARGVAVTADGREAYVPCMPAFNGKPTDDPKEIWHNFVQSVRLVGEDSAVDEDQWTDFARLPGWVEAVGSPDGDGIVVDREARHAWVAVAGRDVVSRVTIRDERRTAIWPFSQMETAVGANPRALALSPDGRQVWVANALGNSLSVIDAETSTLLKTVDLGKATRVDPTIRGQYLFNNAGFTRAHRFTCASCHPDGAADGLTWSFVHVKDGFERRNTRDLRGDVAQTAPFRWSGLETHLADFVGAEVTGLLGGPAPSPEDTQAIAEAVSGFRLPPNPYRAPLGELTPQAKAGQALFEGKAGCAGCHAGPKQGGTGARGWTGTTPVGQTLDVPHLTGVFDSAPYLHDGRAATLEEVFTKYNPLHRHGAAHELSPAEFAALIRYLREL